MAVILEPWIHFLHVLGAIIWVGGGAMLSFLGARTRRSGDSRLLVEFSRTLTYIGLRIFMPAMVAVLLTGIGLVLTDSEWRFTQLWVLLGLGAFIVTFLIGAVYLSRITIQLERLAASANVDSNVIAELVGSWIAGYLVILIILLFAVWDMVFKPGL